jgi:hypothetical protein
MADQKAAKQKSLEAPKEGSGHGPDNDEDKK